MTDTKHSHARRMAMMVLKVALAIAILAYLVIRARGAFSELSAQTIEWRFLALGLLCTLATATFSFIRWHVLIRALGITVRLIDTLRLGALGFALNFVSPGSIGGDFFKAVFLAHGQPGKRTEAVATVVADRVIGLLTMLVIATIGILSTGLVNAESTPLRLLCRSILAFAAIGWIGFGLLLLPQGRFGRWVIARAERLPGVGSTFARLLGTIDVYRGEKPMLGAAFCVSVFMALGFVTSFYMVARALPIVRPPWVQHLVIVPVAGLVGAIPMVPGGVGTMEYAVEEMYQAMPGIGAVKEGTGTLVGLGRRVNDIAVALVGLLFYLGHRREVREVYKEAEAIADAEESGELGAGSGE
jgi:uncharacterized protein (TIRG00374 family)